MIIYLTSQEGLEAVLVVGTKMTVDEDPAATSVDKDPIHVEDRQSYLGFQVKLLP